MGQRGFSHRLVSVCTDFPPNSREILSVVQAQLVKVIRASEFNLSGILLVVFPPSRSNDNRYQPEFNTSDWEAGESVTWARLEMESCRRAKAKNFITYVCVGSAFTAQSPWLQRNIFFIGWEEY